MSQNHYQAGDGAHSGNAEGEADDVIITVLNADPESVVVLLIHQSVTKSFMRNYSENIFNNIAKKALWSSN